MNAEEPEKVKFKLGQEVYVIESIPGKWHTGQESIRTGRIVECGRIKDVLLVDFGTPDEPAIEPWLKESLHLPPYPSYTHQRQERGLQP